MKIRNWFNIVMTALAASCLVVTLFPLISILIYVVIQGFYRINLDLFTQLPPAAGMTDGGIANAILGTLIVVGIAILIAAPLGIMAAIYLAEFGNDRVWINWVRFATHVLSGIPSIVAGVIVYGLLVSTQILGFSAMAGGIALAILILPTIVGITDKSLRSVPQNFRWESYALGASRTQVVWKIVLPIALPGILTGVLLAIARATGETAPLIFTALNSNFWPKGVLEPIATLSMLVYNFALSPFRAQQELAWAGALILVLLVLSTNIFARWMIRNK